MNKVSIVSVVVMMACWAGADIIYSNNFTGAEGVDPTTVATVDPGLGSTYSATGLNGTGQLVSTGAAASFFRVKLSETGLTAPEIKLTAAIRASSTNWVGIGFQGEDEGRLNQTNSNSGPWFFATPTGLTIRGGSGTAADTSTVSFTGVHSAGALLEFEMTYYTDTGTLDLLINGSVITNGLVIVHRDPSGNLADPVIKYLAVGFHATPLDDTGYVDSIVVEAIPEPATIGMLGLGGLVALLLRRQYWK